MATSPPGINPSRHTWVHVSRERKGKKNDQGPYFCSGLGERGNMPTSNGKPGFSDPACLLRALGLVQSSPGTTMQSSTSMVSRHGPWDMPVHLRTLRYQTEN